MYKMTQKKADPAFQMIFVILYLKVRLIIITLRAWINIVYLSNVIMRLRYIFLI